MPKLINIQCITNNQQNVLFRYFIPSLKYIASLRDIISISINYNGDMTEEEIARANEQIEEFGFELHWQYNKYTFEYGKHKVLQIRQDCDYIQQEKSPFILLVDDDLEFMRGYDKDLLIAVHCMMQHPDIGCIDFVRGKTNVYFASRYAPPLDPNKIYPLQICGYFALFGGVLTRRVEENTYMHVLEPLYGGGEDRILAMQCWHNHLKVHRIFSESFKHEQHWLHNEVICGVNQYAWTVAEHNKDPNALYIWVNNWLEEAKKDPFWEEHKYWLDAKETYDYSKSDVNLLFADCLEYQKELNGGNEQ